MVRGDALRDAPVPDQVVNNYYNGSQGFPMVLLCAAWRFMNEVILFHIHVNNDLRTQLNSHSSIMSGNCTVLCIS